MCKTKLTLVLIADINLLVVKFRDVRFKQHLIPILIPIAIK